MRTRKLSSSVALFTRAWIEILHFYFFVLDIPRSPSSRGRGLKYDKGQLGQLYYGVALFTRAWIEIQYISLIRLLYTVALFTRAWIEIDLAKDKEFRDDVALFTRAWIEILGLIAA